MIPEHEYDQKIGMLLAKWREDAGITQIEMADLIGVSRRTIQELEYGRCHAKNYTIYLWALLTEHNQERDIKRVLYPQTKSADNYDEIIDRVISNVRDLRDDELMALDDILSADHRGSRRALLHLFSAYLHTFIGARQMITLQILNAYSVFDKKAGHVKRSFHPDINLIKKAWEKGYEAYVNGNDKYYLDE